MHYNFKESQLSFTRKSILVRQKWSRASTLKNILPRNVRTGSFEMINTDEKDKIPSILPHRCQKKKTRKKRAVPCGACCYICPKKHREVGGDWEWRGGGTTVTPSIRGLARRPSSPAPSSLLPSFPSFCPQSVSAKRGEWGAGWRRCSGTSRGCLAC